MKRFITGAILGWMISVAWAADPSVQRDLRRTNEEIPVVGDEGVCAKHLLEIYSAVQAYRRDHRDLPRWLSDLVPDYLTEESDLLCPIAERSGKALPFAHLVDPKLKCSYLFEFCDAECGSIYGAGTMKMKDLKSLQMALIGGGAPMLRCLAHKPIFNISFDGKFFRSELGWESRFRDVVDPRELWPDRLRARFGLGFTNRIARSVSVSTNRVLFRNIAPPLATNAPSAARKP